MRRFWLVRSDDPSGVSGTGTVAEGVEFTDGSVSLRWFGDRPSTGQYHSIDDVRKIHGHNGSTVVEFRDPSTFDLVEFELIDRAN